MPKSSALIAALAATTFAASTALAADDVPAPADGTNLTQAVQQERRADCAGSIDAVTGSMSEGVSDQSRAAAEATLQAARLAQQAENPEVCATLVEAARDLLGQERAPEQAATSEE